MGCLIKCIVLHFISIYREVSQSHGCLCTCDELVWVMEATCNLHGTCMAFFQRLEQPFQINCFVIEFNLILCIYMRFTVGPNRPKYSYASSIVTSLNADFAILLHKRRAQFFGNDDKRWQHWTSHSILIGRVFLIVQSRKIHLICLNGTRL